jgi:ribose transport system substrate-binding protein
MRSPAQKCFEEQFKFFCIALRYSRLITDSRELDMKIKSGGKRQEPSRKVDKYWVPIVAKTIDLLDCFGSISEALTLEEVVKRTGIPHTTAFRILHTLVIRDYLSQSGRHYRLSRLRKKLKIGFANLSKHICLAVEIQASLEKAATAAGVNLVVWDNDRNADAAVRNAEQMVEEKVDLAIEFQLFEQVAPVISDIFSRAGIPLISLVNPHHGTVYFGVNNYRAGLSAGIALAEHAIAHWKSQVDAILLLESPLAGRTAHSRIVGVLRGLEERLGPMPESAIHHLDGGGDKTISKAVVSKFLKSTRSPKKILIVGINDESAIGAVEATNAAPGSREIVIVGHGGSQDILEVIADPNSPCIGVVSFHAERYGPDFMNFALPIIQGKSAPTGHYVPHEFIGKRRVK